MHPRPCWRSPAPPRSAPPSCCAAPRERGRDVILVSSGAIAVGRRHLGLEGGTLRLEEKQASAATGQIRLAHAYQETLARHHITVAQILLTLGDTEERRRHLNARSTLNTLVKMGAVPVINENDTVATAEIRFGDNDRLAARVAAMISADTLVLLSDIDGLYTADPRKDKSATHIAEITEMNADIEAKDRAQALDCRCAQAIRHAGGRRRCARSLEIRPLPAARRHHQGGGQV